MSPHDIEYYRERALAEHALAKAAEGRHVAEIHEELAKQYEALQPLRYDEASELVVLR